MLKWSEQKAPNEECRYDHMIAISPIGTFSVEWKSWKQYDSPALFLDDDIIAAFDSLNTAKTAAEQYLYDKHAELTKFIEESEGE